MFQTTSWVRSCREPSHGDILSGALSLARLGLLEGRGPLWERLKACFVNITNLVKCARKSLFFIGFFYLSFSIVFCKVYSENVVTAGVSLQSPSILEYFSGVYTQVNVVEVFAREPADSRLLANSYRRSSLFSISMLAAHGLVARPNGAGSLHSRLG